MTVELRTSEAKTIYMLTKISIGDTFNIPFKYLDFDENIKVGIRTQVSEESNDSYRELELDTDYYITASDGTNGVWGVVTFQREHSGLQSLIIYRSIPVSQEKIFNSQTIFAGTTESALDKLTMIAQDRLASIRRYVRISEGDERDRSSLVLRYTPLRANSLIYQTSEGRIDEGILEGSVFKTLRQPAGERADESFVISSSERAGKILAFRADTAGVEFLPIYKAGENITIEEGVISAKDTTYTAGENITIEDNVISATDYKAGENIRIEGGVISADVLGVKVPMLNSWTQIDLGAQRYWRSVCYGNGKFVAVEYGSQYGAYSAGKSIMEIIEEKWGI